MQVNSENSRTDPARETAALFLEAVKKGDSRTFWETLDKKGQGYFLGIWFYAMETMNVETIMSLTGEPGFLDGVLGPIISGLRESMGELLENPRFGEVRYHTPHRVSIRVFSGQREDQDFIPLVLELCDGNDGSLEMNFTCWKIDTLHCFQLNRGTH
ncbi:MAG: hypothetical protein ACOY40_11280 [Bacillota bacterium]